MAQAEDPGAKGGAQFEDSPRVETPSSSSPQSVRHAHDSGEATPASSGADSPVRVLVVDDEDAIRVMVARVLRDRGMFVQTADSGSLALQFIEQTSFDVALVDMRMPEMSGSQLLRRIKAAGLPVEVLMMTAFTDVATTVASVKDGAYGFITKPFASHDALAMEVTNAANFRRLRQSTAGTVAPPTSQASARPGEMIGTCTAMREVYKRIDGVASTNSTILVLGESGTGKELVARAIHDRSKRAQRPMVTVNCAAIPSELVESELFGHARGAFTTAIAARAGLFEAANGGTLFLDEIGDLPISAQVKLLRTLQSGEVKPVGSDAVKTVDVRVVAATNVNLKAAIAMGSFRQDLFYRLNVIAIRIPPLRKRGNDILLLAQHFIQKHARLAGRSAVRLTPEAASLLQRYEWPGNVRELEHAIEHAIVLSDGEDIEARALPAEVSRRDETSFASIPPPPAPGGHPATASAPVSAPPVLSARTLWNEQATSAPPPASRAGSPEHGRGAEMHTARLQAGAPAANPFDSSPPTKDTSATTAMASLVASLGLDSADYASAKKKLLAAFNEAYVGSLLRASGGNLSEAARRSGLDRSNFRRLARTTSVDPGPSSSSRALTDDSDADSNA